MIFVSAIGETSRSFIAKLSYCERIAEHYSQRDNRDNVARQRLKEKVKQKKKQQDVVKAKKAVRDSKALLELFKFEIVSMSISL